MLLLMIVGGVNSAWAETTYESYKKTGGTLVNTNNYFTYEGNLSDINISSSSVVVNTVADGNITIPTALQIQGNTTISFTVSTTATVYVGVYIKDAGENKFQFDSSEKSLSSSSQGASGLVEITSVTVGTHTISKTSSNDIGIYYIKVVESQSSVTFTWTPSASTGMPGKDLTFSYTAKDANNNDVAGTVSYSTTNCSINDNKIELGYLNGCTATITASFTPTSNTYANPAPVVTNITVDTHGLVADNKNISVSDLLIDKTNSAGLSAGNNFDRDNVDGIGFDFNSSGADGVKYNNGDNLIFTNGGSVKIKKTSEPHRIRGVEITYSADNPVSISFNENVGTRPSVLPAGNNVTAILNGNVPKSEVTLAVTDPSNSFSVTNFKVYHNNNDIADKIAPTLAFSTANVDAAVGIRPTAATLSATSPSHFDISSVTYSISDGGTGLTINSSTGAITSAPNTTGTATVTATFAATTCFAATTATYTITVRAANLSGPNNDTQTYPYTWDFTTDWTSSQTQCTTTYDDWQQFGDNVNYYNQQFPTAYDSHYPIGFGIDKLKGLRFSHAGFMAVDWNYGHLWLYNGNITIPGTTSGQIITVVMEARDDDSQTVTGTNTEETGAVPVAKSIGSQTAYTFHSTGGDVTLAFAKSFSIRSISVTNPVATWTYTPDETTKITTTDNIVISGEAREFYTQGNVSFTTSGSLVAGTEITDMPGVKVTLGTTGSSFTWSVNSNLRATTNKVNDKSVIRDANDNYNPTDGCYVKFEPSVSGFITIHGKFYGGNEGSKFGTLQKSDGTQLANISVSSTTDDIVPATPLIAGCTYYLYCQTYPLELGGFTFRPAFLTPDETAEQSKTDAFNAYASTISPDGYPKLVHGDVGVSFSGDVDKVNLANDGTLTLVGPGTTYIRGKAISGANELCAYYKLTSNVLSFVSTTPTNGSTITSLDNDVFQFLFDQNIALVDENKFVVLKDATDITSQCAIAVNTNDNETDYQKRLNVSGFGTLEAGSTYTIRLLAGAVSKDDNANIKNAEVIGTFTVESTEPPLTWLYPLTTTAVKIGSSIVLTTTKKIDETNPTTTVIGTLTYDGDNNSNDAFPMTIKAIKDDKNLVFKPTSPMLPNKLYTLTVEANQVKWENVSNTISVDKIYMFTTGTATGDTPILSSSFPADGSIINLPASNTKVDLYFDQNVDLEPYSSVTIWPVNGGENLSTGKSDKLVSGVLTAQSMTVDTEDPKHVSFEIGSDIKYDLYYQLQIPANTVTGPGGMPNNAKTVFFKIKRNSNSHEVTASSFYPHTWDFNKFGKDDNNDDVSSSIEMIKANTNSTIDDKNDPNHPTYDAKNAFVYSSYDGGLDYVCNNKNSYGFDQGNDIYIATSATEKYVLPEFEGIRVSTKNPGQSKRFAIRNTGTKNADNSDKFIFRMNGNTHYMTLSNVPAGKLYMVVNSKLLGINSPNASFEDNAVFRGTTHDDMKDGKYTRITNTNGIKKLVLNVSEAGDVSFCVGDFSCEKIGVSTYSKPFKSQFAVGGKTYATDCQPKAIRHDLVNAFTGDNVRAYYVSSTDGSVATATELTETSTTTATSTAGAGTIVVLQSGVSSDTEIPFFKTDVNTAANENTNLLRGTTVDITNFDNSAGNKFFFSNLYKQLNNDKTGFADGTDVNETDADFIQASQMGFYRAMGTVVSANKAWLEIPSSSRKYYVFKFDDEEEPTSIKMAGVKNVTDDGNWYTLQGLRVANPAQGTLYIHNGKKVVFK